MGRERETQAGLDLSPTENQRLVIVPMYGVIWSLGEARNSLLSPEAVQKLNFVLWLMEFVKEFGSTDCLKN